MWLVADGFDYYGQDSDLARSVWDFYSAGGTANATPSPRFGIGRYFKTAFNQIDLKKNLATNEATLYAAFAFYRTGAGSGTFQDFFITYYDGTTAQCTVVLEDGGNMTLKRGDLGGTVVATYPAAFSQDVWTHFQVRVVIDPAAGTFTVRKNGQTTDTFSATGLNTRSTANSYANVIGLGGENTNASIDDLLFFSGGGAAPNTWVGDVRCVTLPAVADTAQKQFTPSITTATFGHTAGIGSVIPSIPANTLSFLGPIVPAHGGALTKITLSGNALTGHAQAALYAADGPGATPGTLLATSAVITNPAAGLVDFTFASGPAISAARSYYLAVLDDASWTVAYGNGPVFTFYIATRAYASGFPNPAGASTLTGGSIPYMLATTAGNVVGVSEALANGDTDYVADATVGDFDLYDMDDLAFTPQAIIGVVSKVYIKKSDAGTRQGQVLVSSGGTQVAGPDTVLGSTYTYFSRVDAVDPATSAAWTLAALNAIKVGQKVTL